MRILGRVIRLVVEVAPALATFDSTAHAQSHQRYCSRHMKQKCRYADTRHARLERIGAIYSHDEAAVVVTVVLSWLYRGGAVVEEFGDRTVRIGDWEDGTFATPSRATSALLCDR